MAGIVFKVATFNDEQRIVCGFASVSLDASGELITDLQGDQIEPEELEKAFHDLVANGGGDGDVDHNKKHASTLVGCVVLNQEKLTAMLKGIGYQGEMPVLKGCAAWVEYHVDSDSAWKRVKSGELGAFSIEGTADRVPVSA